MLGKKVTRSVKKLFRNSFDVSSAETRRDVGVGLKPTPSGAHCKHSWRPGVKDSTWVRRRTSRASPV